MMIGISKILVPIQFSKASKHLLRTGVDLARKTGASLYIYHFAPASDMSFDGLPSDSKEKYSEIEFMANLLDRKMNQLLGFANGFDLRELDVHNGIKFKKPHLGIPEIVEELGIELTIMHKPEKFDLIGLISGNSMHKMIKKLSCPCLLINKETQKLEVKNILIPPFLAQSQNTKIIEEILDVYDPEVHMIEFPDENVETSGLMNWFNMLIEKVGLENVIKPKKNSFEKNNGEETLSENKEIDLVVVRSNSIYKVKNILQKNVFMTTQNQTDIPVLAL